MSSIFDTAQVKSYHSDIEEVFLPSSKTYINWEESKLLDESVEYKEIVMVLDADRAMATPEASLPKGFSFRFFSGEEDIENWCRIEASVKEFASETDARKHFQNEFSTRIEDLKKRCIFILNEDGLPIATAMGWLSNADIKSRLHWIAVCPEYQGLGLGKLVSQKAINVCAELLPNQPVWLSTQTTSHRAVLMYHKFGFNMLKSEMQLKERSSYIEDYDKAIEILATVLKPEDVKSLRGTTV